jgi:hypothetical protein
MAAEKPAELRKAIDEVGVDPHMVDPHRILAALAIDSKAAPATRIQACLALIEHPPRPADQGKSEIISDSKPGPAAASTDPRPPDDKINRRALEILSKGTSR